MPINNQKKTKITLITVSYNSDKTIKNTLDSVKSQKYTEIEHLIIDNKSSDKTLEIAKTYPHIKKIISEPDKGIYDAMNKGIKIANGDVIGFLNSDDFYASNDVLEKVANIFNEDSQLDACYADLIYVSQFNTSKIIRYVKSSEFKEGLFSKGWCPPHPTFFVRRSVYDSLGNFDLNYHIASDVELMIRFLQINKIKVRYISEVWVKMRMGGISNKNLKNIWMQNQEIINSFHKNGISINITSFFINKFISRLKQFLKRKY